MYNRECVSYVAYRVATDGIGGDMPYWGGRGNAWQWAFDGWRSATPPRIQTYSPSGSVWHTANAKVDGIPYVSASNVQRGDVAVKNGTYGHVMYVESVNPNGTINISQFNYDWQGTYSEAYNVSTAGLAFLRF
jgi:surface antigen